MNHLKSRVILIATILFQIQPALSSNTVEKSYGQLQGGSLLVETKEGQKQLVSLYHGCRDCANFKYDSYYLETATQEQVSTIEIENYNAEIDIEISSQYRQFPLSRKTVPSIENTTRKVMTSGDSEEVTTVSLLLSLPVDIVLSPFVWGANKIHNSINADAKCAKDSLEFMKNSANSDKVLPVSGSCFDYILSRIRG